jgi:hypothetical protein
MLETAIVGAGPYGLSIAAHFRRRGIPFRIFGRIMDSWRAHMPKGMCLKSDGFASSIYDPAGEFTLKQFCTERGIEYSDSGIPVRLDTFSAYGMAFRERMVPELEDNLITSLEQIPGGFRVGLDTGEAFTARKVVLAVGITHFEYVPAEFASLPEELLSHSFRHHDLGKFRGRSVVVIGGGSSATDLAGLLHEAGADVQLVSRRESLKFHGAPQIGKPRSLWQQMQRPQSGIGPGWKLRFFADAPMVFHYLPESLRLEAVRRVLGPSGAWFAKEKVVGKVPLHLGCTSQRAEIQNGRIRLHLHSADGERELLADHVIAATGYKVNLERLKFVSPEIRTGLKTLSGSPVLSSSFESSISGLYFAGISAANSFGPVMRFAFGAGFAARTITRAMSNARVQRSTSAPADLHQLREIKAPAAREKAGAASQGSLR